MISLTLQEIATAIKGRLVNCDDLNLVIDSVCTDTRNIQEHCLFIALQGASFDAHQFLGQAQQTGAKAFIIHRKTDVNLPAILVNDTRIALGLLGAYVKSKINNLKCAAITGSNGKTTTKELLSAVLTEYSKGFVDVHKHNINPENLVLATAGNFNNDIGLPLTLLRLQEQTAFAVVELGANHQGEIGYTANLAKPDVALVNNVMPAHLEGFGSIEGVAKTKGEIWSSLSDGGTGVVNIDAKFSDDYIKQLSQYQRHIMTFSLTDPTATIFASEITFNELGYATFLLNYKQQNISITLNIAGKHNVSNALAASAMSIALGCDLPTIKNGLSLIKEVAGRVNSCRVNPNLTLIDDTYNANSASLKAAIDLLEQCVGEKTLIFADMGELGKYSEEEHREVGRYAAEKDIDNIFTVGEFTEFTHFSFTERSAKKALHFADKNALIGYLQTYLPTISNQKSTILVKGSRSAKMEDIVAFIKQPKIG
jgi:UDP-N-acetylmuramoyl-tripeptide--D-alanyl-D-alanine ligase